MLNPSRVDFGARLRRERVRRGWTQGELAQKVRVTVLSINRWENGKAKPHEGNLRDLEIAFGKPTQDWGRAIWHVPYPRNLYFTGRERMLARLHSTLKEQPVALTQPPTMSGLGGIGKTQLALEYVYRYADEYDFVLWVQADSREVLVGQFAELAAILNLPEKAESDQRRIIRAVMRWLEGHDELVWLLIFDNADDLGAAVEFLPTRGNGSVLLTTRSPAVGKHLRKIALNALPFEDGVRFLLKRHVGLEEASLDVPFEERHAAEEIYRLVDGLPLALDQAAAYIEEHSCSLADYVVLYQQQRALLLARPNKVDARDYPHSVATTWQISFDRIKQDSPAAEDLLHLIACLHPDAIPEDLLRGGAPEVSPSVAAAAANPALWQETIATLHKHSLVHYHARTKTLSIHRLVQAVVQDGLEASLARQWAERAVCLMSHAFPQVAPETWPRCERLLPHALQVIEWIKQYQVNNDEADRLVFETGHYLAYRGRYAEAESLYQRTLRVREQVWGQEHSRVAEVLVKLAGASIERGKFSEAEAFCQRALTIWEHQSGGSEPQQVSEVFINLAISCSNRGRWAEAEPLYLRALAISEQQLGLSHDNTARTLNNLGNVYSFLGRYMEAEPLYLRALDIWETQLGPENSRLVYSLHGLGALYHYLGRYTEAESFYQRALSIHKRELGSDHLQATYLLSGLANLYQEQGRNTEAEPLYLRALRIWEQQMGPNHPESVWTVSGLAHLYARLGKDDEARELYQRALRIWEEQMGPEHILTIETRRALAELEQSRGNHEAARDRYEQTLATRERVLRASYPQTAEAYRHLIAVLRAMGDYDEAARLQVALSEPSPMSFIVTSAR